MMKDNKFTGYYTYLNFIVSTTETMKKIQNE